VAKKPRPESEARSYWENAVRVKCDKNPSHTYDMHALEARGSDEFACQSKGCNGKYAH